jgi:hypothetical protein
MIRNPELIVMRRRQGLPAIEGIVLIEQDVQDAKQRSQIILPMMIDTISIKN